MADDFPSAHHMARSAFNSQETLRQNSQFDYPRYDSPKVFPHMDRSSDEDVELQSVHGQRQEPEAPKAPAAGPPKGGMMDPSSFPDGGRQAWSCVFGAWFGLFVSFGWINAIGVFQEFYEQHLLSSYTPSTISWIVSLETFFMFGGGPVIGKFYDNYGPRYILLIGTFLHVFGLMMTSISTEYYQILLAQGICSPIGASCIFYCAMNCSITWFFKKRAFALGLVVTGSSIGGVIYPIMCQNLIPMVGFPWTMRIAAFIILGCLVISNLTIRSRLPPNPRPFSIWEFITPLKEGAFGFLVLASSFVFMGIFIPFNYVTLSAISLGMETSLSNYLLAILNAASVFGRTIPSFLADKYGRFNVQTIMCVLNVIFILGIWLPSRGNAPIIVFSAFYGFSSGAFVSLVPALIAQISDLRHIGTRTGSAFIFLSIAALIGNPIAGALLTRDDGNFLYLQIFTGCTIAMGTGLYVVSKSRVKGKLFAKF